MNLPVAKILIYFISVISFGAFSCSKGIVKEVSFDKEIIFSEFISEGVATADVDKDGDKDIIAGHYWFEAPSWKTHEIREPQHIDFAKSYSNSFINFSMDVNLDGWDDYICFDFPGECVRWYENPKGEDIHWPVYVIDSVGSNESPMMVDLDGDLRQELIFANHVSNEMMWFKPPAQPGSKSWTGRAIGIPQKEGTRRYSHGLGWGDINGDGIKDIIIKEGWWEVLDDLDSFPWTFHSANFGPDCSQIKAFDFDNDGDQDVLSASAHKYGIWWHEQISKEGKMDFVSHLIDSSFSQSHGLTMKDINEDGLPDFVTGKRFYAHNGNDPGADDPAVICWFEYNLSQNSPKWIKHVIDDDAGIGLHMVVEDINDDGKLDILNSNKKGVTCFWGK